MVHAQSNTYERHLVRTDAIERLAPQGGLFRVFHQAFVLPRRLFQPGSPVDVVASFRRRKRTRLWRKVEHDRPAARLLLKHALATLRVTNDANF